MTIYEPQPDDITQRLRPNDVPEDHWLVVERRRAVGLAEYHEDMAKVAPDQVTRSMHTEIAALQRGIERWAKEWIAWLEGEDE